MNDFELVKEKNYAELWKKYIPLMNKFYKKAVTSALKIGLFIPYENTFDFQADCYPILINAVDSIKLEKIKNPEDWTLYIQFYRYLQNFISRQVIRPLIRNNNLEFIDEIGKLESEDHSDVDMSMFSGLETKIIEMRFKGMHWVDIRRQLGITGKEMKAIQSEIKAKLL